MIALIQRVSRAALFQKGVSKNQIARIERGMVILCGFGPDENAEEFPKMVQKIGKLRIFSDEDGKVNLSGNDVGAEYLLVSQFTLFADCKKGNRPSFIGAAPKDQAQSWYEEFVLAAKSGLERVKNGSFGADLEVELTNDGPVTIWLDSKKCL